MSETYEEARNRKSDLGLKWVRTSHSAYLCPIGGLDDIRDASEEELRRICIDESLNPQND